MKFSMNLKNKKDPADVVSNYGPILISIIVVLILIVLTGSWMANFDHRQTISQISRKYILKMETTGGLTNEDKNSLISELQPYCKNISLSGTTMAGEAQYGEDIDLYINADMYTYDLKLGSGKITGQVDDVATGQFWSVTTDGTTREDNKHKSIVLDDTNHTENISIHRSSTSKH